MIVAARRFASIGLLFGLVQSSAAQTPYMPPIDEIPFDKNLADALIDEITDSPDKVIVRGHRVSGDGRIVAADPIACWRGSEVDIFAIYDSALKTDERWTMRRGA